MNLQTGTRPRTVCRERDTLRLEKTADLFTARLEYERKQGLLLTEQIRLLEEQLREMTKGTRDNPEERCTLSYTIG